MTILFAYICIHADKLFPKDLYTVYKEVKNASSEWYYFGLALGVTVSDLDNICNNNKKDNDCLREMISHRLKSTDLTWTDVIEALKCETVMRHDVASKLSTSQ